MRTNYRGIVIVMLVALAVLMFAVVAVAGCGEESTGTTMAPDTTAAAPSGSAPGGTDGAAGVVAVTGMVDNPTTLTVDALETMGAETWTVEHPKKGEVQYTGVSFDAVLETLGVQAGAMTVVLTASDGYVAEISLADIESSADAILAIEEGAIASVFPGLETKTWVKDIVSMEFK